MIEYSDELKRIINGSFLECKKRGDKYVDSEHFVLSLLKNNKFFIKEMLKFDISYNKYLKLLNNTSNLFSNSISNNFKKILDNAFYYNKKSNLIVLNDVILSFLDNDEGNGLFFLKRLKIDLDKVYNTYLNETKKKTNSILDEMGKNINNYINNKEKLIGRTKEIKQLIEILARKNKNNPLLIGKAGVGKTAIVEELARRINKGGVPFFLKNTKIIELSMSSLVAGTKYRGEFEEKLHNILNEIENNKNIIIFIDEIHTMVGAGGAEGAIDASNILKPFLARGKIKCIGATTINEYNQYIKQDKALDRRFQQILVKENTNEETKSILKKIKKEYEIYHNVKVSNNIIDNIVCLTEKYIPNKTNPDKSIDILDLVCAKRKLSKLDELKKLEIQKNNLVKYKRISIKNRDYEKAKKIKQYEYNILNKIKNYNSLCNVDISDVKKVIEQKTNLILSNNSNKYYEKLKNNIINKVYFQNEIIDSILKQIKYKSNKTLSFHFVGTKGVGKTLLAKTLASELKYNTININSQDLFGDIGYCKIYGYNQKNSVSVFDEIKEYPNSIIIFNDYNKCSNKTKKIILNIVEKGQLKKENNDIIYLNNCIFIFINNKQNISNIGFTKSNIKSYNKTFDGYYVFNKISKKQIIDIIKNKYNIKRIKKEELNRIINLLNYESLGLTNLDSILKNKMYKISNNEYDNNVDSISTNVKTYRTKSLS